MDGQANEQMCEEMARLTDARTDRSVEVGRPSGTAAGSACVTARLRQSGGEGRGRTGAVWEAPGAALPDRLTHPSLGGLRDRPQGGSRTASGGARRKWERAYPSRKPGGLHICSSVAGAPRGGLGRGVRGREACASAGDVVPHSPASKWLTRDGEKKKEIQEERESFISKDIKIEPSICTFGEEEDATTFVHHKRLPSVPVLDSSGWSAWERRGRAQPRLGEGAKRRIDPAVVGKGVQGHHGAEE